MGAYMRVGTRSALVKPIPSKRKSRQKGRKRTGEELFIQRVPVTALSRRSPCETRFCEPRSGFPELPRCAAIILINKFQLPRRWLCTVNG